MTSKELASQAISQLPDTVTLPEIIEELQVCLAIEEALADVEAGRVYRHEDVMAYFRLGTPLPEFNQPGTSSVTK